MEKALLILSLVSCLCLNSHSAIAEESNANPTPLENPAGKETDTDLDEDTGADTNSVADVGTNPVASPPTTSNPIVNKAYVSIKGGKFSPNTTSGEGTSSSVGGLINFDSGFYFEAAVGGRITEYFALEGGLGGYGVKLKEAARTRLSGDAAVVVIPMTVSAIIILPISALDIFGGAGIGMYTAAIRTTEATYSGEVKNDYKAQSFGYHAFCGFDLNITPSFAVGAEYKYYNSEADFTSSTAPGMKLQIGGTVVNGGIKIRF